MLIKVIYLTLKNFLLIVNVHDGKIDLDSCHLGIGLSAHTTDTL